MIDHAALTDELLVALARTGELIGDGVAPAEGGWLAGQPNVEAFRPYAVLVDGGTNPIRSPNLITKRTSWNATWSIRYFGGSRPQCDWIAGKFRLAVEAVMGLEFSNIDPHRIINVDQMLGPVQRNDQVDPPFWQAFDNVVLHITPINTRNDLVVNPYNANVA